MRAQRTGATYVEHRQDATLRHTKKRPVAIIFSSIMAVFMLFLVVSPLFTANMLPQPQQQAASTHQGVQANAMFEIFCSKDIGNNMDNKKQINTVMRSYPNPDAPNRKWTLQEAYGNGLEVVNYQGLGEGGFFTKTKERPDDAYKPGNYDANAEKYEEVRTGTNCFAGGMSAQVSTLTFGLANMVSFFSQGLVSAAFDTSMICSEANDTMCIDIIGAIGGQSNDDNTGLIAILTNSIYMPLMVIAVVIGTISVIYHGIYKRKLREALGKALWVVGAALLGVIILAFPATVSQAPMVASNALASCVIGAFNGDNCFTDSSSGAAEIDVGESSSKNICSSTAGGLSANEKMSMTINSLNCSIWKAFILEPYSNTSFKMSFDELDTKDAGNAKLQQLISDAGFENDDFCVSLRSAGSVNDNVGTTMQMDNNASSANQVCNLVAYQLALAHDTNLPKKTDDNGNVAGTNPDERWYDLVVLLSHDDGMWNDWTTGWNSGFQNLMLSFLALFTAVLGGFVLIAIAFFALVFRIAAIILTAFAPLFLLFMIDPGRGKSIAGGWFGQLLSSIMKYFASALFLLITVVLYGAVLGNVGSNIFASLTFIIILTGALMMYRREIVDLIGQVNMGTKVFSNKIGERFQGAANLATSVTAGAVGSAMGGNTILAGARDTLKRDMARGAGKQVFGDSIGSFVQGTARQYNRSTIAEEQKVRQDASRARDESSHATTKLTDVREEHQQLTDDLQNFDKQNQHDARELSVLKVDYEKDQQLRGETQDEIAQLSPFFAQAMALMDEIKNLELQAKVAVEMGDHEKANDIASQIRGLNNERKNLLDQIPEGDERALRAEYARTLDMKREAAGIEGFGEKETRRYQELQVGQAVAADHRNRLIDRLDALEEEGRELEATAASADIKSKEYDKVFANRQPGNEMTGRKRRRLDKKVTQKAEEAAAAAQRTSSFGEDYNRQSPALNANLDDALPPVLDTQRFDPVTSDDEKTQPVDPGRGNSEQPTVSLPDVKPASPQNDSTDWRDHVQPEIPRNTSSPNFMDAMQDATVVPVEDSKPAPKPQQRSESKQSPAAPQTQRPRVEPTPERPKVDADDNPVIMDDNVSNFTPISRGRRAKPQNTGETPQPQQRPQSEQNPSRPRVQRPPRVKRPRPNGGLPKRPQRGDDT